MDNRVSIAVAEGIAEVRLARAAKRNALDPAMFAALGEAIRALARAPEVRVAILSGEGHVFCAGLDMASMADPQATRQLAARGDGIANTAQFICTGWRGLAVPVIAAVHGAAIGGGFQIIAGADIRIAHPETRLSIREAHWGLVPDMGGIALWRGLARDDVLRELTFTAREFSAVEAFDYGLVTELDDDPLARARDIARAIAARSPDAVRAAKRLFNAAPDLDTAAILRRESEEQMRLIGTPNQIEAVRANSEGRAPHFRDPPPHDDAPHDAHHDAPS